MAIVVKFEVTGMSASAYAGIMSALDGVGESAPDGRLHHVCYGDPTRLQVIDIFESPAKLEAFGGKLMPILARHGVNAIPQVLGETHNIVVGR